MFRCRFESVNIPSLKYNNFKHYKVHIKKKIKQNVWLELITNEISKNTKYVITILKCLRKLKNLNNICNPLKTILATIANKTVVQQKKKMFFFFFHDFFL